MSSHNGNGDRGGPGRDPAGDGPDLDALIAQVKARMEQLLPSSGLRGVGIAAAVVLVGIVLWSSFYTVTSDSVAVVQRFGAYLKDVPAGLHFRLPLGIDTVSIVPVKRQLKQEFGFVTAGANDPYQGARGSNEKRETEMVTGDLNAALVEWVCARHVVDGARRHLFDGHRPGVQEVRQAMAISSCAAAAPA